MASPEKYFEIRKTLPLVAIHNIKSIWNTTMENNMKILTFIANIEPILLYGSECWTIEFTMPEYIDGCYTRLLRMETNISWKQIYHGKIRSLIHNCTVEYLGSQR